MSRPVIFATYSNSTTQNLPSLSTEMKIIFSCFLPGMINGQVEYLAPPFDVAKDDFAGLIKHVSQLKIFHYSGHAGRNSLLIDEQEFAASQLNKLLIGITVDVVVLNGCSTKGFVHELLKKKGVKAVIATERKVKDLDATEFATNFYALLLMGKSLEQAFESATYTKVENANFSIYRGELETEEESAVQIPWGIYYTDKKQIEEFRLVDSSADVVAPLLDAEIKKQISDLQDKAKELQKIIDTYNKTGLEDVKDLLQTRLSFLNLPAYDPADPVAGILILYHQIADLINRQYEPYYEVELRTKFNSFNYTDQRDFYAPIINQAFAQQAVVGAFLLQGGPRCGLGLLQRNIQDMYGLKSSYQLVDYIEIKLDAKSQKILPPDITDIWQAIGKKVGKEQGNPEDVVAEITKKHQFKSVVMIFSGGEWPKTNLLIINDFWNDFNMKFTPKSLNKVLLFVQVLFKDDFPTISPYDQYAAKNHVSHILPVIRGVTQDVVNRWQGSASIAYPYDMTYFQDEPPVMDAIQEICSKLKDQDPKYWELYTKYLIQYATSIA